MPAACSIAPMPAAWPPRWCSACRPPPPPRTLDSLSEEEPMGTLDGKVAFITGAGRGQGRSHALRLAEEGADIIALDVCSDAVGTIGYALSTPADLDETVAGVEALGRRAVKGVADVRELDQVLAVVEEGLAELGRIDVVCANAGIGSWAVAWEMTAAQWKDMIDINLTGVFNAARAALPSMVARVECR